MLLNSKDTRFKKRFRYGIEILSNYPSRIFSNVAFTAIPISSHIDKSAAIESRVRFYRSSLGRYSYVCRNTFVESCDIGAFCSIAMNCSIGGASHPLNNASTSPVFCKGGNVLKINLAEFDFNPYSRTRIGNDVWIGRSAQIKSGVTISDGAVIGMGSVLTKDVGPYEIWAGNPAKLLRKRFSEKTIEELMEMQWWSWSLEHLIANQDFFEKSIEDAQ